MLHLSRGGRRLLAFSTAMLAAIGLIAALSAGSSAHPRHKGAHGRHGGGASFTVQPWTVAPTDPQGVFLWTLDNGRGMSVAITNYGATVQSINVPDRWGKTRNVALGFSKLSDYVNDFTQGHTGNPWPLPGGSGDVFFGATIGRYANRIAGAKFTMKCDPKVCSNNGQTSTLDVNNGVNTLHGGFLGWNTAVWDGTPSTSGHDVSLTLTQTFPAFKDGCTTTCTGYPASVTATVVYTLTGGNALNIAYKVVNNEPAGGAATVINLTNHTYFNLGGEASGSVFDQLLQIKANQYQPVNTNLIPQGFADVAGTAFDFRHLKPIGQDIRNPLPDNGGQPFPQLVIAHGYDHNFVLNGSGYRLAAVAKDPQDGISLLTYTTEPGVQLYTGNFLVGDLIGTSGHTYRQTDAFTLETQHYPDSPNHIGDPAWPSVVLNPASTFTSTTTYQFATAGHGHYAR